MSSLLVTNDFPPKVGGIQSVLWEFWRRLDPARTTVLTTGYPDSREWDRAQAFRVERVRERVMLPRPGLVRRIDTLAAETRADIVFVDPMLPLGLVVPHLDPGRPVVVLAHGAEITVPGRLPVSNLAARRVLRAAAGIVAFGGYPAAECLRAAGRALSILELSCGVDTSRFAPLDPEARALVRKRYDLDPDRPLVLGQSRLVPRKGFDVLIDAVARLEPDVQLAIGGSGRDRARLERHVRDRGVGDRVRFLGRVPEAALAEVFAMADVFAMLCRGDRWGGLEAEGFGIVFVEAAASGVPAVAGRSGGAHEAVVDGETGYVVGPRDVAAVTVALDRLLRDHDLRTRMGAAALRRARVELDYDRLVSPLARLADGDLTVLNRRTS
jgi:phosphatidylinositol alpha-1,6-mannosyltransferase